jgi:hypothetical protein
MRNQSEIFIDRRCDLTDAVVVSRLTGHAVEDDRDDEAVFRVGKAGGGLRAAVAERAGGGVAAERVGERLDAVLG